MKKTGFTLAEVLITLTIIGVIATLTLPALMNNTAEQQYKAGLKKGLNTLTIAGETNEAIEGFNYAGTSANSSADNRDPANTASIYAILASRASVDLAKCGTKGPMSANTVTNPSSNFAVYFRDGSVVMFKSDAVGNGSTANVMKADGLPYGIPAVLDVNGPKQPNLLSNCAGTVSLNSEATSGTNDKGDQTECNDANRVIKDRFAIRLRGHYAVPNGRAAKWAMEH